MTLGKVCSIISQWITVSCLSIFPTVLYELFESKDYVSYSPLPGEHVGKYRLTARMNGFSSLMWVRLATELWTEELGRNSLDCEAEDQTPWHAKQWPPPCEALPARPASLLPLGHSHTHPPLALYSSHSWPEWCFVLRSLRLNTSQIYDRFSERTIIPFFKPSSSFVWTNTVRIDISVSCSVFFALFKFPTTCILLKQS